MGDASPLISVAFDSSAHDATSFSCGEADLDEWLRKHATNARAARVAQTFVWIDDEAVVGAYYSISAHAVSRAEAPSRIGRGVPDPVPAALIAKLALDQRFHGQGLGAVLAADAIVRIIEASRLGPAVRAVVVDASTERGRRLYEHLGFTPVRGHASRMIARAETLEEGVATLLR